MLLQKTIYGGSYNLLAHTLPNFGITASFVNIHDLEEVEAAIQEQTRAIYVETLGNPNSDIPDLDALAELAHKQDCPWWWIIPLEHLISSVPLSMVQILWYTLPQNSWEDMAQPLEESL